jgi:hypothetical protein
MKKLQVIKEHRDYIAHGKRYEKPAEISLSLREIAETLDGVISEIQ